MDTVRSRSSLLSLVVSAFMLLWVTLLVLAPVSEQSATAPKSVITLHPPWTTVFYTETVRLTCNGLRTHRSQETKWYYNDRLKTRHQGNTLEARESGDYRCQAGESPGSDAVRLTFSRAQLILQAPLYVYEGDHIVLKCQPSAKTELSARSFYKDEEILAWPGDTSDFHIFNASLKDNGRYHCTGSKKVCCNISSNRVSIQVRELFPPPVLTASPSWPRVGSPMTLTCKTQLPLQKSDVQLQFCFFKDAQPLRSDCSSSPELRIPAMSLKDSGYYSCTAKRTSLVLKQSKTVSIQVQDISVNIQLRTVPAPESVFLGEELNLLCSVDGVPGPIKFSWYKEKGWLREVKMHVSEAEFKISVVKDSDAGTYRCEASNGRQIFTSQTVTIKPAKAPASWPVLSLSTEGDRALEGDTVTLYCEVQRGSPPILYKFFRGAHYLGERSVLSPGGVSLRVSLTTRNSGNYYCTAYNGFGAQRSDAVSLSVTVPVSRPVLMLRTPRAQAVVGDTVELHCEAPRGSPPILYRFYHEDVALGSSSAPTGGGASFHLSLTAEHSGNYLCEADNGVRAQRSDAVTLRVTVPVSCPVLTLRTPRAQAVVGDTAELHCETPTGSPPILYRFHHEDVALGNISAPLGRGVSFSLFLMADHSGNYSCDADNGLGAQRSDAVTLRVTVPASRPILTFRASRTHAVVGDEVELHCESPSGSPPILYQFYHEDVALGNSSAPSGGGASFNLSLTAEHSGNYSCEADNGLGAQRSMVVTLNISGLTEHRRDPVATGLTGGLLGSAGLAAGLLLFYCWLPRKAGGKAASDPSRSPADLDPQEPTYHNIPGWVELQPVYANVTREGDVVYLEVQKTQKKDKDSAAASAPSLVESKDSYVIYAQVKKTAPSLQAPAPMPPALLTASQRSPRGSRNFNDEL